MKGSLIKYPLFNLVRNNYRPWALQGYVFGAVTLTDNDIFCYHCSEPDSEVRFPLYPTTFEECALCLNGGSMEVDYSAVRKGEEGKHLSPEDWLATYGWSPDFRFTFAQDIPTDRFDVYQVYEHPRIRDGVGFYFEVGTEQLALISTVHLLKSAMELSYGK